MTPTLTIRTNRPGDAIAAAHYQLGYAPTNSLVTMSLRGASRRIGLVARIDLDDAADAATSLAEHMTRDGASAVIVVAYTDDRSAALEAANPVITALGDLAFEAMRVSSTGYGPLLVACEEFPLSDITDSVIAAEMIGTGIALMADRAGLLPQQAPVGARTAALAEAERRAGDGSPSPAEAFALWRAASNGDVIDSPAAYGALGAALVRRNVRDAVLTAFLPATPAGLPEKVADGTADSEAIADALGALLNRDKGQAPGTEADTFEKILAQVIAHTHDGAHAPAAWTLWGLIQWWRGNGGAANDALKAALAIDPDYSLANLLTATLSMGIAPGWLQRR
jgi:hypothetical protein